MYQRDGGSWRKRNEALKRKVLQDVGGFLFDEVKLNFLPFPARHKGAFSFVKDLRKGRGKKCPKRVRC